MPQEVKGVERIHKISEIFLRRSRNVCSFLIEPKVLKPSLLLPLMPKQRRCRPRESRSSASVRGTRFRYSPKYQRSRQKSPWWGVYQIYSSWGIDDLKDAIINKFKKDSHLTYKRSEILVSCGGKHSFYNLAQAIFDQGDEVIIPAPYWVSYPPMVALAGGTPVIVETTEKNEFKITPEDLNKALTPRTKPSSSTARPIPREALILKRNWRELQNCDFEKLLCHLGWDLWKDRLRWFSIHKHRFSERWN